MIVVTTTAGREAHIRATKAMADALGVTDSIYAGSSSTWWQRIAGQAEHAGGLLILDKDAQHPMVVLPLAVALELAGLAGER